MRNSKHAIPRWKSNSQRSQKRSRNSRTTANKFNTKEIETMKRISHALLSVLFILACVPAFAQVVAAPSLVNFQGRLAKPDGTPVPNGTYSIRFSLWTALSGGTEKW